MKKKKVIVEEKNVEEKMPDKKYNAWDNLKKAFKYAKKQKKEFIIYFFANIILALLGAILPLLSAKELLKLTDGLLDELLLIAAVVFVFEITTNFCRFFARKYSQIFAREVLKQIQIDIAYEVLRIETSDLDKKSSGVFIDRLVKDTGRIADIFLDLNMSLTDLVTNFGILVAIFIINKFIFVFYCIAIFVIFYLERIRIKKFYTLDKHYRKTAEATTGLVGELVRGVRDVKVLNATSSFMNRVNSDITKLNQERYKMSEVTRRYALLTSSVRDICDLSLVMLGVLMIYKNYISASNFLIIYMYRSRVFNLLTLTTQVMEWFKDFNLSAGRVFEVIDSDTFKKEQFGEKHLDKLIGDFEFKDVHFHYKDNQEVLKGINFKINHNETVSFVGPSGAGKSTIFSLLARLYVPNSGTILIDGIPISELDCDSIRGNISIITQNPYIFNMTIRENFTIVQEGLTEEEMIKACKMAKLHDFIMSLPDGYDTLVGEGGLTLSGGQRQRLSIARALAQKTGIILFDEATSALDNETQKGIQDAINNMKNKYTILIIAHRLSTVINSDRIMVVDKGKIVATGSHKELLKKNKTYKDLYELEMEK